MWLTSACMQPTDREGSPQLSWSLYRSVVIGCNTAFSFCLHQMMAGPSTALD
jgi:hypothetical protein